MNKLVESVGLVNKAKKLNRHLSWRSLNSVSKMNIEEVVVHYKKNKVSSRKPPTETRKKVEEFYNHDCISRQLPYKNLTCRMKVYKEDYMRVTVQVMEVTLKKAYNTFINEHPGVKIGRRSFESLRPKNIHLRCYAQRLQCCCTYHTNMDYIRKAINSLFTKNNKPNPFPNNDVLISSALCEQNSIKCILQCCEKCVDFSKIDDLAITSLKCSKSCFKENKDCTDHTIKLNQFQRVSYMHKGKEKKKLKLVDNMLTTSQLVELLKNSKNLFCTDLTFNRPQKHMIIFLQFLQNGISFHPV